MIIMSTLFQLLSNAVTLRRDKSILYSRTGINILLYCIYSNFFIKKLVKAIGLFGGLFHATSLTKTFHIFFFLISALILQLTAYYPRKVCKSLISKENLQNLVEKVGDISSITINKMSEQFKILEYSLIILFIISGAILLMSSSDLISMFLSIELQSFGLYILSTIYKNSELSTRGGLTYFLLGGLSSCFILLGSSLLYTNTATTSLDGIYVITSLSGSSDNGQYNVYESHYINISLIIMTVGFLFKVSAAPFHFWSPDRRPGKSSLFGCKLPNSGNTLELLVPSCNRKVTSGWINHSCTVTSQKASEKNVGNRGSKSAINNIAVKEQRVYGNWYGNLLPYLRCTLTGFERNYQARNQSNLIIQKRRYIVCKANNNIKLKDNHKDRETIDEPWFISGFTDAEGCFLIIVRKAPKNKMAWGIEVNFRINLHKKDINLLKLIQSYFGVGRIGKDRNGCSDYVIGYLDDILAKIIPHFDKYPLKTKKKADYILFREVVMIMKGREHLTRDGLQRIINIRATINKGLNPALETAFPNTVPVARPDPIPTLCTERKNSLITSCDVTENKYIIHPQWVAGFTSGDGCFKVIIRVSKAYQAKNRVNIIFVLTQHIKDKLLLESLVSFFECGQAYSYKDHTQYISQSFIDNYEKILPFFRKYPIKGVKSLDLDDWGKVAEMIKTKAHLTNEGFYNIRLIKTGMNKGRFIV
jgi:hypothetical protein